MKAEYFKDEEEFYAKFPKEKREAIKAFWASKSQEQLQRAEIGHLFMCYDQEVKIAQTDAEMAASLLDVAASHLEDRRPMPYPLADYIAKAFREAASATETESKPAGVAKRDTLGHGLKLTSLRCRPKTTPEEVGGMVFRLMAEEAQKLNILSEAKALKEVAQELELGLTTVKDHWYQWQSDNAEGHKLLLKIMDSWKKNLISRTAPIQPD